MHQNSNSAEENTASADHNPNFITSRILYWKVKQGRTLRNSVTHCSSFQVSLRISFHYLKVLNYPLDTLWFLLLSSFIILFYIYVFNYFLSLQSLLQLQDQTASVLCSPSDVPDGGFNNQIPMVMRGNCTFYEKVRLAQINGARGLLIVSRERLVSLSVFLYCWYSSDVRYCLVFSAHCCWLMLLFKINNIYICVCVYAYMYIA